MFERLDQIEARYEELNQALASPEIVNDSAKYQKTAKAHSEIAPIVEKYREYKDLTRGIAESKALLADEKDADMRANPACIDISHWQGYPDFEQVRAIYEHTVSTLKYDKTGTGWGRGDIAYACDAKKGNCTDFHAVFIGLCRARGIPARFEIGFSLPTDKPAGEISGYHCWADGYVPGYSWIPVDCSEAQKHPEQREYFFGAHDEHRVAFSTGRDIRLNPPQKGERLNFFVYPYVEVDGKPYPAEKVQRKFSYKDVE